MRTCEQTHPWISFVLNLQEASYQFWLVLGQAQAKCEQIAGTPLSPAVAKMLYRVYLAKGAMATTAIEGNTLTEEEVRKLVDGELKLPPSREYLGQEVQNIIVACNQIAESVFGGRSLELRADELKAFNALVLADLDVDHELNPGLFRQHSVGIGRYRGAPAEDCPYLVEKLCQWLNTGFEAPAGYQVSFGILKAIIAHIYIAWIHPFGDGNGRTARLLEFQILLSAGVPATAAHLLSNHYNQTRTEYYRQLERTHRSGGDVFPFLEYALQGFVDGLGEQIQLIENQQLSVHWINYVHDQFRNRDRATDVRKRRLVIDLTGRSEAVPLSEVRHISPRIAEAYANKTDRTVKRDIDDLESMGLVVKTPEGIRAKTETMLAFLPPKRSED